MTQEQKKFIERVGALAAADMQKKRGPRVPDDSTSNP